MALIHKYGIERGYLAIDCQRQVEGKEYIARGILLDNMTFRAIQTTPMEACGWENDKIVLRRKTHKGIGSAYLIKEKKWVTMVDDEVLKISTEDVVSSLAGNTDVLVVDRNLNQGSLPLWLNTSAFTPILKCKIEMKVDVSHLSEMADLIAEASYQKELSTPESGEDYYQRRIRVGSGMQLSKGFWFPVEWNSGCFGAMEIVEINNGILEGRLFLCHSDNDPTEGTLLYRESGWRIDSKTGRYRTDFGRISSLSRIEEHQASPFRQ